MFNSNTLDTIIAMVIVLLILSLVVQSVQQGLKKLLKIKSRQIEDSLVDLFEHVLDKKPPALAGWGNWWQRVVRNSPVLRIFGGTHPAEHDADVKRLYVEVKKRFEDAGRVSQRGKLMLDSIAKSDLVKVLGSVAPTVLTPDFEARVEKALAEFEELKETVKGFEPSAFSAHLGDDAKEKLAKMQGALRPLVSDIETYLAGGTVPGATNDSGEEQSQASGASGGQGVGDQTAGKGVAVGSPAFLQDILKLRTIRLEDVSTLIAEAQESVEEDLARKQQETNGAAAVEALTAGANTLRVIASGVASFDRIVDLLLANLKKAEDWFDTVMQSFEERYTRGMKTWGIVISLCVVVLLNANFFDLYKRIAASDTLRGNIMQMHDSLTKQLQDSLSKGDVATVGNVQQVLQATRQEVQEKADLYTNLGFKPLWEYDWKNALETSQQQKQFLHPPGGYLHSLLGWAIMILLLSAGAPFWEDTLESLFGLKNVLRKQSDTKNVENKGGQPKP